MLSRPIWQQTYEKGLQKTLGKHSIVCRLRLGLLISHTHTCSSIVSLIIHILLASTECRGILCSCRSMAIEWIGEKVPIHYIAITGKPRFYHLFSKVLQIGPICPMPLDTEKNSQTYVTARSSTLAANHSLAIQDGTNHILSGSYMPVDPNAFVSFSIISVSAE